MKTKKMTLSHKAIIYADGSDNKLSCWNAMCVTAEFLRTNYCIRIGTGKWIVEDASGGEWTFKECGEKGFILDTSPLNPGDTTFLTKLFQRLWEAGMQRKPTVLFGIAAD